MSGISVFDYIRGIEQCQQKDFSPLFKVYEHHLPPLIRLLRKIMHIVLVHFGYRDEDKLRSIMNKAQCLLVQYLLIQGIDIKKHSEDLPKAVQELLQGIWQDKDTVEKESFMQNLDMLLEICGPGIPFLEIMHRAARGVIEQDTKDQLTAFCPSCWTTRFDLLPTHETFSFEINVGTNRICCLTAGDGRNSTGEVEIEDIKESDNSAMLKGDISRLPIYLNGMLLNDNTSALTGACQPAIDSSGIERNFPHLSREEQQKLIAILCTKSKESENAEEETLSQVNRVHTIVQTLPNLPEGRKKILLSHLTQNGLHEPLKIFLHVSDFFNVTSLVKSCFRLRAPSLWVTHGKDNSVVEGVCDFYLLNEDSLVKGMGTLRSSFTLPHDENECPTYQIAWSSWRLKHPCDLETMKPDFSETDS